MSEIHEPGNWGFPLFRFQVDVLPPHASIEAQVELNPVQPGRAQVRFRAVVLPWLLRLRLRKRHSEWSGWFIVDVPMRTPIVLQWNTFWAEEILP